MKGLILDTSGKQSLLAISHNDLVVESSFSSSSKNSSTFLLEIKEFLKNTNTPLNSLDYIAVGVGPGSFLGTRVGVILAKTLAYALKLPLIHFCSLQPYKPDISGNFLILLDAKSKGFYALQGSQTPDGTFHDETPILLSVEELENLSAKTSFLSPDIAPLLTKAPFLKEILVESKICFTLLGKLCCQKKLSFNKTAPAPLEIHYLRLS